MESFMKYATSFDINCKSSIPETKKLLHNAETIKQPNSLVWHSPTSTQELKSEFKSNCEKSSCDLVDNKIFHKPSTGYSDKNYNFKSKYENYANKDTQVNHVINGHWDTIDTEDRKPTCDAFGNYNWASQHNSSTGFPECKVSGHTGYNLDRKEEFGYKKSQECYHWQQIQTRNLRADNMRNCLWMQPTSINEDRKPVIDEKVVSNFFLT